MHRYGLSMVLLWGLTSGICAAAEQDPPAAAPLEDEEEEAARRLEELLEAELEEPQGADAGVKGAQERDEPKAQEPVELDPEEQELLELELEDDELLSEDPPAGEAPQAISPEVELPPAPVKAEIDARAAEVGKAGDEVGDEIYEELKAMLEENPQRADAEIERRLQEAEERLSSLKDQLERLSREEAARERSGGKDPRGVRGYGEPLKAAEGRSPFSELDRERDRGGPDAGAEQHKWWQKLLKKVMEGLEGSLAKLAERRTNELKAKGDSLSLATDPRYRAYADAALRREIEASSLSRHTNPSGDARLNDLFFRKQPGARGTSARTTPLKPTKSPGQAGSRILRFDNSLLNTRGAGVTVKLLPRVRDGMGKERVIVDMPLGAAPALVLPRH